MTATHLVHQMQNQICLFERPNMSYPTKQPTQVSHLTHSLTHQSFRLPIHRLSRQFISTDHLRNSVSLFTRQSVHCFLIYLPFHSKNEHKLIIHALKSLHWLLFSKGFVSTWGLCLQNIFSGQPHNLK